MHSSSTDSKKELSISEIQTEQQPDFPHQISASETNSETKSILYAHVVNMARVGNSIEKFTSGEIRHLNSTLLIIDPVEGDAKSASLFPKINTYANQDWKGFPIIMIERAIFYGGFHRDIGSGGYFSGKDNIPNFKPELMFDIAKWLKEKWQYTEAKTSTWGEQSLESMVGKTLEINARRATLRDGDKTIDHSNTEYFDVNGNLIKIATKKYTNEGGYLQYLNTNLEIAEDELRHNECHIAANLSHIKSICITSEDIEGDKAREEHEKKEVTFLNSRYVTYLLAKKLQKEINDERKKILDSVEAGNYQEMQYCVDMEIAKVQLALEKTLFCKKMLAYHQDKRDPGSNEIMKLAFRSKKIKEPTFANEDPKNFEIWLESQKKYLNEELKIHESALAKFESDYQVSLIVETAKILDGSNEEGYKKSLETINQKTSQLKSNQSLRDKIQSEITSQLQQSIPLMIYNKRESKIEKIKEKTKLQLEDETKYNPEDLTHNFLFDDLTRMFPDYEIKTEVKDNLLIKATDGNDVKSIEFLISKGANVDAPNEDRLTPLYIAAQNGHLGVVNSLIEKGANVDAATTNGSTPLLIAAQNGHLEVVKTLIEKVANVDFATTKGLTPLHLAANNGHLEVVKTLIDKGADVNATNKIGFTPLHIAAKSGHLEVVKTLIDKGADVNVTNINGVTPLHIAAKYGHLKVVNKLIEKRADVNAAHKDGFTSLHLAAQNGNLEVVDSLIENGADVNANKNGCTPLHLAANNGHLEVVDSLIKKGADVNAPDRNGFTPLNLAAKMGHLEIVRTLFENGANYTNAQQEIPDNEELKDLLNKISQPDEIKKRDCNLERKKIAKLQKNYIEGFKVDTSPSLETSPEVHSTSSFDEISQSSPPSQQDHHLTQYQKTFQNELLKTFRVLKFAATYFATSKDSVLTNQEVFSEILSNAIENDQIGLTTLSIVKNLIDQNPTQEDLRTAINEFEFLQQTDKELIDYSATLAKELIETNDMEDADISEERAGLVRDDQNYHTQIEAFSTSLRANSQPQIDLLAPEAKTTIEQKFSSLDDDSLKKAIFDGYLKLKSLTDKKTQQILQDQNSPSESPKKHKIDSMLQGTESAEGPLFKKSKKELGVSP